MKEKYDAEMADLENQEKSIHSKYFAAKSELTQVQEELIKFRTSSNQFERALEAMSKVFEYIWTDCHCSRRHQCGVHEFAA